MKLLLILLFGFCIFPAQASGKTGNLNGEASEDPAKLRAANILLKDGTKIWGLITRETADSVEIRDFIIGPVTFSRNDLSEIQLQPIDAVVMIETLNGTAYFGKIEGLEGNLLVLSSSSLGTFTIPLASISKIASTETYAIRGRGARLVNPNATRYFFAPSAIPLKKREGYYQNAYLLANSVNVGLTDNITIGGGVVIPLLFYVTPKVSFRIAKYFYAAGGLLYTQSFISDFDLSAGIGYGIVSAGSLEHNLSLGAGYGFARFNSEYKNTPMPIVMAGGMTRIGKKLSLVSENWFIPRAGYQREEMKFDQLGYPVTEMVYESKNFYSGAVSLGIRFMPGMRTSVDFCMVGIRPNPDQSDLVLPYLDFVYKFN